MFELYFDRYGTYQVIEQCALQSPGSGELLSVMALSSMQELTSHGLPAPSCSLSWKLQYAVPDYLLMTNWTTCL